MFVIQKQSCCPWIACTFLNLEQVLLQFLFSVTNWTPTYFEFRVIKMIIPQGRRHNPDIFQILWSEVSYFKKVFVFVFCFFNPRLDKIPSILVGCHFLFHFLFISLLFLIKKKKLKAFIWRKRSSSFQIKLLCAGVRERSTQSKQHQKDIRPFPCHLPGCIPSSWFLVEFQTVSPFLAHNQLEGVRMK